MDSRDKISVRGAADESGMSVAWWRKAIRLKRVPYYKVGGLILISRRDINMLFRKSRVGAVRRHQLIGTQPSRNSFSQ